MMHSSMHRQRSGSSATYALRCAIVVTMVAAVATLLHLSHYNPKQTFLSCDRPCHHLDWPMICRVKLTLEVYQSLSRSCGNCPTNETDCFAKHCILADGQRRGLLTANRQMPGPSIQVCENDILVVDVVNRLPGRTAVVHWRGQSQSETPCMDGAPLVTQCPIPSYTTFQYKFRAAVPGTHLWHAHAGADVADGIFGSLIVRQADLLEPHRALYDTDDPNHVILITEWQHSALTQSASRPQHSTAASLLVNGKGRQPGGPMMPLSTFVVIPGRRHRFRAAHAGGAGSCPFTLSIDGHPLLVIALDGHPVDPKQVNSITLVKGERVDFVLKANQAIYSYRLNVRAPKGCVSPVVEGAAILRYKGSPETEPTPVEENLIDTDLQGKDERKVALTTSSGGKCESRGKLCITEMQAMQKMPKPLAKEKVDLQIYLPVNYSVQSSDFIGGGEVPIRMLHVGNATFTFPSSPLLTQGGDVAPGTFCSGDGEDDVSPAARCRQDAANESHVCECVHVRRVPLGANIELILLDQAGLDDLVYHLHGYSFRVVGARQFGRSMSLDEAKELESRGTLLTRNLDCAPLKDTVAVPKYGVVALRFKADNPGYWMLRDEHSPQWTRGLDVVLQVGEPSEMIPAPLDFPKCGSFVGPDYFLI